MSTKETQLGLSTATLVNAIQFPVDVADLVLGLTTADEMIERGKFLSYTGEAPVSPDPITAPDVVPDMLNSHQLAANQVSRAVTTKLKFK